jgi:hypothetical protein
VVRVTLVPVQGCFGGLWGLLEEAVFPVSSTDVLFNPYNGIDPQLDVPDGDEVRRENLRGACVGSGQDRMYDTRYDNAVGWIMVVDGEKRLFGLRRAEFGVNLRTMEVLGPAELRGKIAREARRMGEMCEASGLGSTGVELETGARTL